MGIISAVAKNTAKNILFSPRTMFYLLGALAAAYLLFSQPAEAQARQGNNWEQSVAQRTAQAGRYMATYQECDDCIAFRVVVNEAQTGRAVVIGSECRAISEQRDSALLIPALTDVQPYYGPVPAEWRQQDCPADPIGFLLTQAGR